MSNFLRLEVSGPKRSVDEFLQWAARPGAMLIRRGVYEAVLSIPMGSGWLYERAIRRYPGLRLSW